MSDEDDPIPMSVEEATAVLDRVDWSAPERFTKEEVDAVRSIVTWYMVGVIDAGRCASVLRCTVDMLPDCWVR